MIVKELLNPSSIVIVGASNDVEKPGGKVLKNILDGHYDGRLFAVNPKEATVQGIQCYNQVSDITDNIELAIIAIGCKFIPAIMEFLAKERGTKAFIVLSAGFSETGLEGKALEEKIVEIVESVNGSLIGPNCIGILSPRYNGVFAGPIPKLESKGCDFVSGSGATAVFILESAIPMGLTFASLFSVGNSAQIGVEEVVKFWDKSFDPETSSKTKIIYIEEIKNSELFLKHTRSLINKGCRIAAIKAGTTEAGSRAVSSHTGALAGSDVAVDALFRKAGIVRCYGREELVQVAAIFSHKPLTGDRLAIITHAGGPGVMATDALSKGGLKVPHIQGPEADDLLSKLFHGSSIANPIDFLATGNAEQLGMILDYVDNKFDNIDGSLVIFGTTGMFDVTPVYNVLNEKMNTCKKPIYPVMPSLVQAKDATEHFLSLGRVNIQDEVNMARALSKVYFTPKPAIEEELPIIDTKSIREIIDISDNGYLSPQSIQSLFDAAGIPHSQELVANSAESALFAASKFGYPLVMKVVGPVHKSDVGGVALNIKNKEDLKTVFQSMIKLPGATGVLIQPMLSGMELFIGAKYEKGFGHVILCGMGGIFVEVFKDVMAGLSPLSQTEALYMIRRLKAYPMIKGVRGKEGINENMFADIIVRLSALLKAAPEIRELDINPLLGKGDTIIAVDSRIRVEK
jgi:acetate---CoA ligase (ADP-forming)